MSGHIFGRSCKASLPTAVRGEGCYLIDSDGKRYLDGSDGAAVSCLGHSDEGVKEAIRAQLDDLAFAHTGFLTSDAAEELADMLLLVEPGNIQYSDTRLGTEDFIDDQVDFESEMHRTCWCNPICALRPDNFRQPV